MTATLPPPEAAASTFSSNALQAHAAALDANAWRAQYRDLHAAAVLGQRLLDEGGSEAERAAGGCHAAFALLRLGRRDEGAAALARAWPAAWADGGVAALAGCRNVQALLHRRDKQPALALELLEQNLRLPQPELWALSAQSRYVTHNLAATSCSELARLEDALRHYLMARDEAQRSGDEAMLANASANLSGAHADVLNLEDAAQLAQEAITAAEQAGLEGELVWLTATFNRCYTALAANQAELAMAIARRMRRWAERVPQAKRARYELLWAGAAVAAGHAADAARLLARSRRRWVADDDLLLEWSMVRAGLDNSVGRHARARAVCDAARELTTSGGEEAMPQDRMRLYNEGSRACEALGDAAAALAYTRLAFAQYERMAGRSARARRIAAEAQLALEMERRNHEEAQRRHRAAEAEQARLAELNAALHDANRAKTRFLAAASHDLRQPLHALALQAANLRCVLGEVPQAAGLAERMEASVQALSAMCDALLDISQIESGSLQPRRTAVRLRPLLMRLAEEAQPQAEQCGLRLALRLPHGAAALRVDTDAALLETMLRNLIANALKYTRCGGVLLALRRCHGQPGQWRVQVLDTGVGIEPEAQQRVFEDYVQLGNAERQRSQGLGLGLAIVRRLAMLLAHPLALRSRPGRGTTLTLQLAEVEGDAALNEPGASPWAAPLEGPRLAGLRVAVVEDDPDALQATVALLRTWQVQASGYASGQALFDALADTARQGAPRVASATLDALISDLRLPGALDGLAVARRLRSLPGHAAVPVLLVSADAAPAAAASFDWLAKPMRATALYEWLARLAG